VRVLGDLDGDGVDDALSADWRLLLGRKK